VQCLHCRNTLTSIHSESKNFPLLFYFAVNVIVRRDFRNMFSIINFFSMVVLMVISSRVANAFKITSNRWMRTSAISMQADSTPAVNSGDRINKIIELDSPKVVSPISLNAGEKCVVCRCWKRFVNYRWEHFQNYLHKIMSIV
jgi:hypothetical protein